MPRSNVRALIDEFLALKRIALVGVSRNPKKFSRRLFAELRSRGYDVVPVNPTKTRLEGLPCYEDVQDIEPPVEGAMLMTSPEVTEQVLKDCVAAKILKIWIYGISGEKAVSGAAMELCRQHGISVVPGYCPYMFLSKAAFFHRLHGFVQRLTGQYPK